MKVVVVGDPGDDDLGTVETAIESLAAAIGGRLHLHRLPRNQPASWAAPAADLVVSLGSDASAHWPEQAAPVRAETELLRAAHDRGTPVLGICYGAHVLARALGGGSGPSPRPELGWADVEGPEPWGGRWFEWHDDRCHTPPGSEVLATTPGNVQAWRAGRSTGVQFHPEVTARIVDHWVRTAKTIGVEVDSGALLSEVDLCTSADRVVPLVAACLTTDGRAAATPSTC
ncbi:MAG: type 1 glutamine amidotransferase [Phycicoccus sp.]